jgi:hypothetical protein
MAKWPLKEVKKAQKAAENENRARIERRERKEGGAENKMEVDEPDGKGGKGKRKRSTKKNSSSVAVVKKKVKKEDKQVQHFPHSKPAEGKKGTRPDVTARHARAKDYDKTTVVMSLSRFCMNFPLLLEIRKYIQPYTRVFVQGTKLISLYVLRCLEQRLPLDFLYTQTFFYRAFAVVAGSRFSSVLGAFRVINPANQVAFDVFQEFLNLRSAADRKLGDEDYDNLSQTFNYAAKEFMVACMNHVSTNMSSRVAKAMKVFLLSLQEPHKASDNNRIITYYMRVMERSIVPDATTFGELWKSLKKAPSEATKAAVIEKVNADLQQYRELPLDDLRSRKQKIVVSNNWAKYLPWLHEILRYITAPQQEDAARKARARAFSILPDASLDAHFVTIDTKVLRGFLLCVKKAYGGTSPSNADEFKANSIIEWQKHFDIKPQHIEGAGGAKTFARFIKTNGASVSIVYERKKKEEKTLGEGFSRAQSQAVVSSVAQQQPQPQPQQQQQAMPSAGGGGNSGPLWPQQLHQQQQQQLQQQQQQAPNSVGSFQQQQQPMPSEGGGGGSSGPSLPQQQQQAFNSVGSFQQQQQPMPSEGGGGGSSGPSLPQQLHQPYQQQQQQQQQAHQQPQAILREGVGGRQGLPQQPRQPQQQQQQAHQHALGGGSSSPQPPAISREGVGGSSGMPQARGQLFDGPHLPRPSREGVVHHLDDKRVVGVDPGRRHIVHCATRDAHGATHTFHYSSDEFR